MELTQLKRQNREALLVFNELQGNSIDLAVSWVARFVSGGVAMASAVIAVASIGFLMLTGRMDVRRSVRVILGCFIIFGASAIANGLIAAMSSSSGDPGSDSVEQPVLTSPAPAVPVNSVPAVSDPYAGAAVPPR